MGAQSTESQKGYAIDRKSKWARNGQKVKISAQSTESQKLYENHIHCIQDHSVVEPCHHCFPQKLTASKSLNNLSTIHNSSKPLQRLTELKL
jgi:hypothetical protein